MTRKHANRAIIVLESPWELDGTDANRSSVLPFVEGVAKLAGDMEVLHANYYDQQSFDAALGCLAKAKYRNAIVYLAAHGGDGKVGDVDLMHIFVKVGEAAGQCNITGLLIGSCYGAESSSTLEVGIQESPLRWCVGYASSASWLEGTLIDCAIMSAMADLPPAAYGSGKRLTDTLADAISPFSPTFCIGSENRQPVALGDSLQFVVQPDGQGHKARNVSSEVFARRASLQL